MSDINNLQASSFSRFLDEDGLHTLETRIDEVFARKGEAGGAGPRYVYTENPVTEAHYEGEKLWNNDHFYTLIDDIESGATITTTGVGKNAEEDTIPDGVYASVIGAPGSGGGGGSSSADDVSYDNTDSGLTADNVQDAIDEVQGEVTELNSNIEEKIIAIPMQVTSEANGGINIGHPSDYGVKFFIAGVAAGGVGVLLRSPSSYTTLSENSFFHGVLYDGSLQPAGNKTVNIIIFGYK